MSVEKVKKFKSDNKSDKMKYLDKMKYDCHKLNKVFLDILKFAIDNDLVNCLYTLLMLRKFPEKVGIYRIDVNEVMKTENVEIIQKKTSALFDLIVMLGESLEDIKLELSYLEIRKKYNLSTLLVETYVDMTDSKKIEHMLILIQHGLDLQDDSDDSDESDDLDLQDD